MKFYCGIDLSARDCHVCVIDQQLKIVVQQKLGNELPKICRLLEPYQANLKIVVESTFKRLTETFSSELRDLIGPASPIDWYSASTNVTLPVPVSRT